MCCCEPIRMQIQLRICDLHSPYNLTELVILRRIMHKNVPDMKSCKKAAGVMAAKFGSVLSTGELNF